MFVTHDEVRQMALEAGFTLRAQPDGSEDLSPYVYRFARMLIERVRREALEAEMQRVSAEGPGPLVVKFDRDITETEFHQLRDALRSARPGPLLLMPKEMDLAELDDETLRRAGLMRIPPAGS